jgi:integrase
MAGCRALTEAEVALISRSFGGKYTARDRALFLVGVHTGFRISELLSLRVGDVWQYGQLTETVSVARRHMKRKREGRTVRFHPVAQQAVLAWLGQHPLPWHPETFLFRSREGDNRPLQRIQAWQILHDAFVSNQLQGHVSTHSMRKTFAARVYAKTSNLRNVQKLLGHADLSSTGKYLDSATPEELDAIVLSL